MTAVDKLFPASPAFERRGFMLDVSRDRVPTRETIAWLIDVLAALRFNELQLYVEHTFAYADHEVVWRDASPLTHDDMAWIARRGAEQGVDLVANMNGFGHMARWLIHDEYRDRAECPDGAPKVFGDGLIDPTCLAPTEANAELAVALAREMLGAVGGDRIHIGGDEPFELGEGLSADRVAEFGRDRVYLDHLNRIIEPLVADGTEVLFWADLFRRDHTLMADIPTRATGVVWHYEAPSQTSFLDFLPTEIAARLGLPDDANLGFEAHARLFIDSDTPFWVAPGTATWNTILGRNQNAAANVVDAAAVGAAHGAQGYLLTDWGDNGHWQPLAVSLPSMVRAATAAWHGGATDPDVGPVIDELVGADAGTGQLLDTLGHLGETLGLTAPNGSPVFAALVDTNLPTFGQLDESALARARTTVDEAEQAFADEPFGGPRGAIIAAEMVAACGLARLGLRRLAGDEPSGDEIDAARAVQREAWLQSSRPGGLDDSVAKLRRP
ncbi:MAG: family 20 glycosylhydrolase [Acidimicrobiia bacterium]|nr:family 20 glycosylhydrolase [Acidimicrobiia bacterium]